MNVSRQNYGELSCQSLDMLPHETAPGFLIVLCHGFGAPGDDLVPLGAEMLARNPRLAEQVRFVFPAAPLT